MTALDNKTDLVVYLVAIRQTLSNQRIQRILNLREPYMKMVLVTNSVIQGHRDHIEVRSYPNPTGILRLAGLHKAKKLIDRYLFFPSPRMLYVWAAQKRLKRAILDDLRKGRKVCVITSVPPHDICLIGLSLKTTFKEIYWIVDWRDLWSYDEYYFKTVPNVFRKKLLSLEMTILGSCDINVTTNVKAKAVLEKQYNVPPHRVISINQCFYRPDIDKSDTNLEDLPDFRGNAQINIGFLGNLFKAPKMPGRRVVDAIDSVAESGLDVKLHIFGDLSDAGREAARQSRNGSAVFHPRTSHRESLRKISGCDLLLLAMSDLPNCQVVMNIKLPHYLLIGRPILAMVPEGSAVADIIRETGTGYVIPTTCNWGDELKKVLRDYLAGKKCPDRNERAIEKYSWESISKQWMEVYQPMRTRLKRLNEDLSVQDLGH